MAKIKTPQRKRALHQTITMLFVALLGMASAAQAQIIDLQAGTELSEAALVERLRDADIVLLGELHDNAEHHRLRGRLIAQFATLDTTVVAEHLPANRRVRFRGATDADLEAAGFNRKGWGWPLHAPLFEAIRAAELRLVGGNLPAGMSKELFARGEAALPLTVAALVKDASLNPQATRQLRQDLVDGHCGKLPEKYLAPMQLVQRATDTSMADVLMASRPSVLIAGNGHVRRDYGVPQVVAAVAPQLSVVSIGFVERGNAAQELIKSEAGRYDVLWLTDKTERADPCENFRLR